MASSSALIPGPNDPEIFSNFSQNIIVGRLGNTTITPKTMTSPSRVNQPALGIAIFPSSITTASKPSVQLTKNAVTKIVE
jgi:hypothetical protein